MNIFNFPASPLSLSFAFHFLSHLFTTLRGWKSLNNFLFCSSNSMKHYRSSLISVHLFKILGKQNLKCKTKFCIFFCVCCYCCFSVETSPCSIQSLLINLLIHIFLSIISVFFIHTGIPTHLYFSLCFNNKLILKK